RGGSLGSTERLVKTRRTRRRNIHTSLRPTLARPRDLLIGDPHHRNRPCANDIGTRRLLQDCHAWWNKILSHQFQTGRDQQGQDRQEISRSIFKGRTISQFLQISEVPMFKSNVEMYTVKVLDPQSGSVLMNLGTNQGPSVKALESIQESFYCQYCGRKNDPSSAVCSNCGANL